MRQIEQRAVDAYRARFAGNPEVVASAPGRVNLLGEHTDYNGGFVLPCAIDCRVAVALGRGAGGLLQHRPRRRAAYAGPRTGGWADYPHGVVWALEQSGDASPRFRRPSPAMCPLAPVSRRQRLSRRRPPWRSNALCGLNTTRADLALLCQRAENEFVQVQSGIMDQYASLLCQKGNALLIDCRSLASEQVPLDLAAAGLSLVVCDTRVKRRLAATGYNERRAICARAAEHLGVSQLRDATPDALTRLSGEELRCARHVVSENARVLAGVDALRRRDFAAFGQLMWDSHASLRADFGVSIAELDAFVEQAQQVGALGARLTGAGFGGCAIAIIASAQAPTLVNAVAQHFAAHALSRASVVYIFPGGGSGGRADERSLATRRLTQARRTRWKRRLVWHPLLREYRCAIARPHASPRRDRRLPVLRGSHQRSRPAGYPGLDSPE